jgi:hypothetical protein
VIACRCRSTRAATPRGRSSGRHTLATQNRDGSRRGLRWWRRSTVAAPSPVRRTSPKPQRMSALASGPAMEYRELPSMPAGGRSRAAPYDRRRLPSACRMSWPRHHSWKSTSARRVRPSDQLARVRSSVVTALAPRRSARAARVLPTPSPAAASTRAPARGDARGCPRIPPRTGTSGWRPNRPESTVGG